MPHALVNSSRPDAKTTASPVLLRSGTNRAGPAAVLPPLARLGLAPHQAVVHESIQAFSDFSTYSLIVSIAWSFVASAREQSNSPGVCHVVAVSCWYVWHAKALSRPNRARAGDAVHIWLLWNWSVFGHFPDPSGS